jgi:hypothetical protein
LRRMSARRSGMRLLPPLERCPDRRRRRAGRSVMWMPCAPRADATAGPAFGL